MTTTMQEQTALPALLTIPRAAELLGISRASAYRYAAAGELPVRRLGSRVYVVTARLLAMVDQVAT
jgi:excisionase family DNA binding protein